ncbi:MAG: 2-hydroxyacyl-CoA dehydratase [Dehalococcoidales bacterium]|nr:2-hydroxyacyl-CoA dehydratase [Dehalococcoidales bacterium]
MDSEFLDLCGFEPEDAEKEIPRVEKAFEILGIKDEDIERAKAKINRYVDIELLGMRKVLGLWIKELVDMVLAKEEGKKVIYVSYPPIQQIVAALALTSDDIYCASPDIVLSNTLNLIFDMINPVLETAEQNGLAPGTAFCSYLQTRLGAIVKGIIPEPDLLIPSCFLCDLTPACDQLISDIYGTPVAYIDNLIDEKGEGWPYEINPRKITYFSTEMSNAIDMYCRISGHRLPEKEVTDAVGVTEKLFFVALEMQQLREHDPLPLSQNDFFLALSLGSVGRGLKEGPGVLNILLEEVKNRIAAGEGVMEKGLPRVMLSMMPHDPSLVAAISELGLVVGPSSGGGMERPERPPNMPLWDDVALSHMQSRGANYSSLAYILQLKESIRYSNVEGVILFRHYSCRQYSIFPIKAKEMIEEELGVPVLLLEGDYCDFRSYTTPQMRTRLETFAEMVKNNKNERERTR